MTPRRTTPCPPRCSTSWPPPGSTRARCTPRSPPPLEEDLPGGSGRRHQHRRPSPPTPGAAARSAPASHGVVAGLGVAALVFHIVLGDDVEVTDRVPDGTRVAPGDVVMRIAGPTRGLLTAERTALNFACHLSGVATATARWVDALDGTRARVLDTRKTLPGRRALQKYAVRCGGGVNHRFSLSDMAMVKDNHVVAAGGVVPAYEAVRAAHPDLRVEVEVTDLDQLRALLEVGCTEMLLDNMDRPRWPRRCAITAGRAVLEASGGLTLERARAVAETGVDFISVGALTHSVNRARPRAGPRRGPSEPARRRHRQQPHRPGLLEGGEVESPTGGSPPTSGAPPTSGRCCCAALLWRRLRRSTASRCARPSRRCCTSGARCWRATCPACPAWSSSPACAPASRCAPTTRARSAPTGSSTPWPR